jgi:hypothetical protein
MYVHVPVCVCVCVFMYISFPRVYIYVTPSMAYLDAPLALPALLAPPLPSAGESSRGEECAGSAGRVGKPPFVMSCVRVCV